MSTTIKIILPVTSEEDIVSGFSDAEDFFTHVHTQPYKINSSGRVEPGHFNTGDANNSADARDIVTNNPTTSKVCKPPRCTRQTHCVNNNQRQKLQHISKHYIESREDDRGVSEQQQQQQQKKLPLSQSGQQRIQLSLSQTQHQMSRDVWSQGHLVILDKNSGRARSSTHSSSKVERPNIGQHTAGFSKNVRPSAIEAYDIDLEHRDMMMKALRFYTQYCRHEGSNHCIKCNGSYRRGKEPYGVIPDFDKLCGSRSFNRESTLSTGSNRISRCVKMAQCRLRFYDDGNRVTDEDKSATARSQPLPHIPLLYALADGDGVLADSMGHTYRSTQTRPWSALPKMLGDTSNGNYHNTCRNCHRRFQKTASVTRCNVNTRRQQTSDLNPSRQLSVVGLTLCDSMSQSIPHSVAYQRRNQTTHLWTDSSNLMSRSVPTATFLHRHVSSASSSPRSSCDDSGKANKTRPSSSYSYDGGFFVGAHSGQAEYFVIHPDWVSEAMTVKRAPLEDKKTGSSLHRSLSLSARMLPEGRRCLSAPPKQRNPITMDHAERQSAEGKSRRK